MPRPVPLNSLRTFEAVARHVSFTRAALELHITPGAVSQQIRALEQQLGASLFKRSRRSVALTELALRMLPDVQAGFAALSRATHDQMLAPAEKTLTISVAPSFASKWLVPRLTDFSRQYADIDLRISATVGLADFKRDHVDLAIRLGRGNYPSLHVESLFTEAVAPLCSPALVKKVPLRTPDDLQKHRLLHDTSIPGEHEQSAWVRWLNLAHATQVQVRRGARFSLADLALQAAMDGAGVVMGRLTLAERDIAAGRLVQPFKIALPLDVRYFLVMEEASLSRPEVQAFRGWLFGELKSKGSSRKKRARA